MEFRFNQDFGHVRVHADRAAAGSAEALGANAFTAGSNIYFAAGKYAPDTDSGKRLLAHELTHTIQQRGGAPSVAQQAKSSGNLTVDPDQSLERDADRTAERVMSSAPGAAEPGPVASSGALAPGAVQRQPVGPAERAARAQKSVAAMRRHEERLVAQHDRGQPNTDYGPLGDPHHVVELAGRPMLDDLSDYQKFGLLLDNNPVELDGDPVRLLLSRNGARIIGSSPWRSPARPGRCRSLSEPKLRVKH